MGLRVLLCAVLCWICLPPLARASEDPTRARLHLQAVDGLVRSARQLGLDAGFLAKLESLGPAIASDALDAAARTIRDELLPRLDGLSSPPDVLPRGRDQTILWQELDELALWLDQERSFVAAGQSSTLVSEQDGVVHYRRHGDPAGRLRQLPLVGAQFFPFWGGSLLADPDGPCQSPGDDRAPGCVAEPGLINGDNIRGIVLDRYGTPARTVPWSYEYAVEAGDQVQALTAPWTGFLRAAEQNQVNLVRVFASYLEVPEFGTLLRPWRVAGGVALVREGVCDGNWNETGRLWPRTYFDRLRGFIAAADARGLAVQLTLFTRQEVDPPAQPYGTWSAEASDLAPDGTGACADGTQVALPYDLDNKRRAEEFFEVFDGEGLSPVGRLQQSFIRKMVREARSPSEHLPSGYTNVVFEVMNEPSNDALRLSYPPVLEVVRWEGFVVRTIRETEAELRRDWPGLTPSLISVNAAPAVAVSDLEHMDVYVWQDAARQDPQDPYLAQIEQVGLISYHAILYQGGPELSLSGINAALAILRGKFIGPDGQRPTKALMLSTDGLRLGVADVSAPGSGSALASITERSTCAQLASSVTSQGSPVDLGHSACGIQANGGPCFSGGLNALVGADCAVAHGIPNLARVYRHGYREGAVEGPGFAMLDFLQDLGHRVLVGQALRADPPPRPSDPDPTPAPRVTRYPGVYHFHDQSSYESALEDLGDIPRPTLVVTVPVQAPALPDLGQMALAILACLALGAVTRR